MFDAVQNEYGYWVGRFRSKDGVMIPCSNACHDKFRAVSIANRMAAAYERNRRAGYC